MQGISWRNSITRSWSTNISISTQCSPTLTPSTNSYMRFPSAKSTGGLPTKMEAGSRRQKNRCSKRWDSSSWRRKQCSRSSSWRWSWAGKWRNRLRSRDCKSLCTRRGTCTSKCWKPAEVSSHNISKRITPSRRLLLGASRKARKNSSSNRDSAIKMTHLRRRP